MRVVATPGTRLLLAVLLALLSAGTAAWYLTAQPLIPDAAHTGAVATPADTVFLTATDRIEEPDFLDSWREMDAFFDRQGMLAVRLHEPGAAVADGAGSGQITP